MKLILMFLILIALTLEHPVHMAMLLFIFGSVVLVVRGEKKEKSKNAICKTSLLAVHPDEGKGESYRFLITYRDGRKAVCDRVYPESRRFETLIRHLG